MPVFAEFTPEELDAIRHFIRERAEYEPTLWSQISAIWGFIVLMIKMQLLKHGWIS